MPVEATLRLVSAPQPSRVMLLGVADLDSLMKVFEALQSGLGLTAFEFFTDRALHHVRSANKLVAPLETPCPLYVVTEFDCADEAQEERALKLFSHCLEQGWLLDGVISQSENQAAELWRYREGISESISHFPPYKNDLSVTVSRVPEFLLRMEQVIAEHCPQYEVVWYGHIGDGNLHMNILKPADVSLEAFEKRSHEISDKAYELTAQMGGSISAEHGIGLLKQPWLGRVRSEEEISLMRAIKKSFDPSGIFNPGKLLG